MIYLETRHPLGRWSPEIHATRPETITVAGHLRLKRNGAQGPKVRAIAEVPASMRHLTLEQLRQTFSPDGNFYATKPAAVG